MVNKIFIVLLLINILSCQSEAEKKQRESKEEQYRIELALQDKQEAEELAFKEDKSELIVKNSKKQSVLKKNPDLKKKGKNKPFTISTSIIL